MDSLKARESKCMFGIVKQYHNKNCNRVSMLDVQFFCGGRGEFYCYVKCKEIFHMWKS